MTQVGIAAVLSVALAACGSSNPSGTCKTIADCAAGQFCNSQGYCQTSPGCTSDSQCSNGQSCDLTTGQCLCQQNGQCPAGQICNQIGTCQASGFCASNSDCPAGTICNTQTNGCIDANTCGQNLNCPQGQICAAGVCQTGCTTDGDCVLVDYTQTPPAYEPAACVGGVCVANGCHSTLNCGVFDLCLKGTCVNECATPTSGTSLCQACVSGVSDCPGTSLCLGDPSSPACCTDGSCTNTQQAECKSFCSIDCSSGQPCPAGMYCSIISLVNAAGTNPGEVCNAGQTCTGAQETPCPVQEGQASAVCPCYTDSDCPSQTGEGTGQCDVASGSCYIGMQCGTSKQYSCATNDCGPG